MIIKHDIDACFIDGERTYTALGTRQFEKAASSDIFIPARMKLAIDNYKPDDAHVAVIVHGLGSSDCWGQNRNGDLFPEQFNKKANLINEDPENNWGYPTFEKSAYPFREHNNRDPKNALGPKVVCAAWNPAMHRVEVMLKISRDRAPDVAEAIERDEPLMWSMGARVPFDVCTACQHRAKTAAEYCDHLKYERNKVLPNGIKIGMVNPEPHFFDMSQVKRGADRSAYSLAKVASADSWGGVFCYQKPSFNVPAEKVSVLLDGKKAKDVSADIEKEVPMQSGEQPDQAAQAPSAGLGAEDLPNDDILSKLKGLLPQEMTGGAPNKIIIMIMQRKTPEQALPEMACRGMVPSPEEVKQAGWKLADIPVKLDFSKLSATPVYELDGVINDRSLFSPILGERLLKHGTKRSVKQASNPVFEKILDCYGASLKDPTTLEKWASKINLNLLRFVLDKPDSFSKYARYDDTGLKPTKLILAPLVVATIGLSKKAYSEESEINTLSAATDLARQLIKR